MATLVSIAGKNKKCSADGPNTGRLGCQIEFGTPLHLLALKKGTNIPSSTDFTLSYLNDLIKAGTVIPLTEASAFEDLSAEDAVTTNSSGVDRLNLKGLIKYKFMYEEGHQFYKELSKMTSFKAWDFMIGDENGNWKMAVNSDGSFKGFKAGQSLAEMTKTKVQGGDSESKSLIVQFLDRSEHDENYDIFTAVNLGFQPDDIQGINPVKLEVVADPADGDTLISVKPVLLADGETFVSGSALTDYEITVNGSVSTITNLSETDGVSVDLTIAAVAENDVVTVTMKDQPNLSISILHMSK